MAINKEVESRLRQFKRNAKVTIWRTTTPTPGGVFDPEKTGTNGIVIEDMRIEFEIERNLTKNPNTCDVTITNLSEASRAEFSRKPLLINLEAGYDGINRLMFVGDLHYAASEQKGTDWSTLLQMGDGDRIHHSAKVSKSYNGTVTAKQVLRDICKSFGQDLPANVEAATDLDVRLEGGTISFGRVRDELTSILAPYGYSWSFQNGKVQILKDTEANRNGVFVISEETGMIGTPEFGSTPRSGKPPHMTVNMFLFPEILPGSRVKVISKALADGNIFKVISTKHRGDTHAGDWFTTLEIKPL